MPCQPFATTSMKGSVFAQALWSDKEATRSGYLAGSHIPHRGAERHAGDVCPVDAESVRSLESPSWS